MTLHVPVGRNHYCGPAALTILTGGTTDEASALIRRITGQKSVFGVTSAVLVEALVQRGFYPLAMNLPRRRVALDAWARRLPWGRYLVVLAGHYVVVRVSSHGVEVADNHSIYPLPVDRFLRRRRGKFVKQAWRIQHRNSVVGLAIDGACITCGETMTAGEGQFCDGCRG